MAHFYVFACGGAGLKAAIALVLLASGGYTAFKTAEGNGKSPRETRDYRPTINIIPCDIDVNSAQYQRLKMLCEQHEKLRGAYGNNLLEIKLLKNVVFSIEGAGALQLATLVGRHKDNILLKALFTDKQLTETTGVGTKGDMQLGSFIAARFIDEKLFDDRFAASQNEQEIRITFTGSVNGGTGPSVAPTAFTKAKEYFSTHANTNNNTGLQFACSNPKLGFVCVLPYYAVTGKGVAVQTVQGPKRSKTALTKIKGLHADYTGLVGGEQRRMYIGLDSHRRRIAAKASNGSEDQLNPLMPEDIAAALLVFDSFIRNGTGAEGYYIDANDSAFNSLPDGGFVSLCVKRLSYFLKIMKYFYLADTDRSGIKNFYDDQVKDMTYFGFVGHFRYSDAEMNRNNLLAAVEELELNCLEDETTGAVFGVTETVDNILDIDRKKKNILRKVYNRVTNHSRPSKDANTAEAKEREFAAVLWNAVCDAVVD